MFFCESTTAVFGMGRLKLFFLFPGEKLKKQKNQKAT